jgi:hypothetical protein
MAPQSVARGAPRSGDRAAAGMPDRAKVLLGCPLPATGSHLPLEETAPPYAVSPDFTATQWGRDFASGVRCQAPSEGDQPFASSPFAHPIPQSQRRANGNLFRASLASCAARRAALERLQRRDATAPRKRRFTVQPLCLRKR